MARDYYAESEAIAAELRSQGRLPDSEALRDCILGGATSTEILFGLRFELSRISRTPVSEDLRTRVVELRDAIDHLLESV